MKMDPMTDQKDDFESLFREVLWVLQFCGK